ncbi:unnamed protein product [Cyprideis torosa]|uniref:Prolyl endopeptidase n=1 Tax=Cyprideis torosa TaxID=163714 RepID=A0A7R8WJS2_9CRUS|nr:unnamed protein product [Cyprideis torosa]CAG0896085.1 unnamed protein product [Cyprideis torosa]
MKLQPVFNYPKAFRDPDSFVEYHGEMVPDPYQYLEDPDAEPTKEFVEAQNKITYPFLKSAPSREYIKATLTAMLNYPKFSVPFREGEFWYHYYNPGLRNQYIIRRTKSPDDPNEEAEVFLDPNALSEDGTISLSSLSFSKDGSICAYGISEAGSDWHVICFKNAVTGEELPDKLRKVKFSSADFNKEGTGVFYACYKDSKSGTSEGLRDQKLYFHRLGTSQDEDLVVMELPDNPEWIFSSHVSDDFRYLLAMPMKDCHHAQVYIADLTNWSPEKPFPVFQHVVKDFDHQYSYVANHGSRIIFRTNRDGAVNYKLATLDLDSGVWEDLIPHHSQDVLDFCQPLAGDKLVVCWLKNVQHFLQVFDATSGQLVYSFDDLPPCGTIQSFQCRHDETWFFFKQVTFTSPGTIFKGEVISSDEGQPAFPFEVYREINIPGVRSKDYEMTQVFYPSHDATKVPMFILSKRLPNNLKNGNQPTLLYGYGGFNHSLMPEFSITWIHFLSLFGGVVAIANIRGGGEYGRVWHEGGKRLKKMNTFKDFIAAAEYLIKENYTKPDKIVIQGASNGGLLVAACCNLRPDLFGASITRVGVLDMLRYHKFSIGHAWIDDYGSPEEDKEMFNYLMSYSPLHNLRKLPGGQEYPSILLMTADHDDRVLPFHSLKYIAEIQHLMGHQKRPLLIRVETRAGHGKGKPTGKVIEELTDIWCFVQITLALNVSKTMDF